MIKSRRHLWCHVALAVLVGLLSSCAPSDTASEGAGTHRACPTPSISITAPAAGAQLAPGPVTLTGSTEFPGQMVSWVLADAVTGAVRTSGVASSAADSEGGGTFTVPLVLDPGGYKATITPPGATAGASGTNCDIAEVAVTVAAATGPAWVSGASGPEVATGDFAAWRGTAVTMSGTWVDSSGGQLGLWPLQVGGELADWTGDLDVAVGALEPGESWAAATQGAYDERWATSLQRMAQLWAGRPGTIYIRFAHEFNGDWYPWSVTPASLPDFVIAWHRYRALQQQYFPASKLVFAPNSDTAAAFGVDWRTAFPGVGQVDVISTSYFNAWPWVGTVESFQQAALAYDRFGGPRGIQRHLDFARSVGVPFAVSEWGNNAGFGDSPTFVQQMYGFFNATAAAGPSTLAYEILFNVAQPGLPSTVMPQTNSPLAAEAYRQLW